MAPLSDADIERLANALSVRLTQGDGAAAVARAAAYAAVQEHDARVWGRLGYNLADVKDSDRLHKNMAFIDMLREGSANIGAMVIKAVAMAAVLAILAWIALGAKLSIGGTKP